MKKKYLSLSMEDKTINIKDNEIEQEENGPIAIQIPFDPNKIKVSSQPHTIGEILDRIRYDEIKLDTEIENESSEKRTNNAHNNVSNNPL
jgi:hypothetical protein